MAFQDEFARRLQFLIDDRGLTHKEVLERARPTLRLFGKGETIAHNLISRYINQRMYPTLPMITGLARALDTSTDYLCALTDDDKPRLTDHDLSDDEKRLIVAFRTGALQQQLKRIGVLQKLIIPDARFDEDE